MKTMLVRVLPAAALAAVVSVSASTGAVAGALVTGADIKNGTVTGKDVKNRSLTAADLSAATVTSFKGGPAGPAGPIGPAGIGGLQRVENTKSLAAGVGGTVIVTCPEGKRILGLSGDWPASVEPTSTWISPTLNSGIVYGFNTSEAVRTLRGTATCAVVD